MEAQGSTQGYSLHMADVEKPYTNNGQLDKKMVANTKQMFFVLKSERDNKAHIPDMSLHTGTH